jgi:hypothetical protein
VAPKPLARVAIAAEAPGAHWSQTLAYAPADGVRRKERRKSSRRGVAPVGDRRSPLGDRRAPEPDAPDDMAAHHERRADDVATHHERRADEVATHHERRADDVATHHDRRAPTRSEDQR